jgi:hypothetical protein
MKWIWRTLLADSGRHSWSRVRPSHIWLHRRSPHRGAPGAPRRASRRGGRRTWG